MSRLGTSSSGQRFSPNAPPIPLRPPLDIQETLKILRFRFRRNVGFRPVIGHGGACFYRIDGRLRAESEILLWAL